MTTFPKDFLWSASTAATQIEGGWNADGKGESIWDTLVHDGTGKIAHGENADISIDFYHRWREDVALMKQMGLKAYRFSISWARVLPEGIGKVNEAGIRFYQDFCDELLKNGIQPLVTLYHWDLPTALYRQGGWKNPASPDWFAEYAEVVSKALAGRVGYWLTFNEPQMFCGLGLVAGVHAPFEHPAAVVVAQNLQGVFALFGAVDGAPLFHARAGDGFAVAILGVVGFPVAAAAHIGVEQFGGQFFHHRKHRAARNVGLVDTRRAGDIKTIAPAGIPLGPDAVKRKADLRENIRAECLFRPGRADSRGCFTYFDKFIIKATPHNSRFTA